MPPGASENARFPVDPFAGIAVPDKFRKDGRPDIAALVSSYGELETRFNTKTDELKAQIAAETLKDRPKAAAEYKVPKLKDIDDKELNAHPMIGWWREQAFEAGLPQQKFEKAIETYIETMQPQPIPEETLKSELGDGFRARIAAVDTWAKKTARDAGELDALARVATDPAGVKVLERLAGLGGAHAGDEPPSIEPELTLEKLRVMQSDARYWDATRRDPAFVARVEEGYRKLYPAAKAS